jgi:hypothetical protein
MNGNEQPLERLNYYNGQRLEATDFRLEQEYHLRVRRWLNKSLYTWGIAAGLEVTVKEGDPHKVVVHPGLALDAEGREIILLEAREIQVAGMPSKTAGLVFGNYLVIQYVEEKVAVLEDGCCAVPLKDKAGQKQAWGGPSRIRSEPKISWLSSWPKESSGQIVLAQVELDEACAVRDIRAFVRKYVGAAKAQTVRAFTLEGEKDIDKDNSKVFYFHIEGGLPTDVRLYLRGAQFSTLYYTELGKHTHEATVTTGNNIQDLSHTHTIVSGQTETNGSHSHGIRVDGTDDDFPQQFPAVDIIPDPGTNAKNHLGVIPKGGEHSHMFSGVVTDPPNVNLAHQHTGTGTTASAGTPDKDIRPGNSLQYINELGITFDDQDVTDHVLAQLRDRDGPNTWQKLGDGTATHDLVAQGTREIDLIRLGVNLSPGEHHIKLSVADGGGKIQYNLYVE